MVTLDAAHTSHWTVLNVKPLTVTPSFDYRSSKRRCHYLINRAHILWVKDREVS